MSEPVRCSWEGCTAEEPYDADWKCPASWGLVEWIPPGKPDTLGQAVLCPDHFRALFAGAKLK